MKIRFDKPPASAKSDQGLAVRYAQARRKVPQWRWYLLLVVVLALPAYFTLRFVGGLLWVRAPAFVQFEQVEVRSGVHGRVVTALAEGSPVSAGQALLTVMPPKAAEAETVVGADPARGAAIQDALRHAEAELELRANRLAIVQRLVEEGAAPVAELATAQAQWLAAQSQRSRLRADWALWHERRPSGGGEPAAATPAALSPVAGSLLTLTARIDEPVERDSVVAVVRAHTPAWIRAYLAPGDAAECGMGAPATLVFEDDHRQPARIRAIQAETRRIPAERLSPLETRTQALVVDLVPSAPLNERHAIHNLPLEMRCQPRWLRRLNLSDE